MPPSPTAPAAGDDLDAFRTTPWMDALGGFIAGRPGLWRRLGNLETLVLRDELDGVRIEAPVFVAGLARSGTTKLLEVLAEHPLVATHRYKDYPPIFTPYWWNRLLERMPQKAAEAKERAHKDGIEVTPDSPEALEEVLWMAFFARAHNPGTSNVLDAATAEPAFEAFYREHITKLVRVRGARRYLSKGNYNVTRLGYLRKLFPDARFVVPIRDPAWHVASLMKQHALFNAGCARHPKALTHLRRVGHYEFGPDRRPINTGDAARVASVQDLWRRGEEVEGWARYWSLVYDHVADRLEADPGLRDAVRVVRYEDFCREPRRSIEATLDHCRLDDAGGLAERVAGTIRFPSYYRPDFSEADLATIARHTGATAARFGYGEKTGAPPRAPARDSVPCIP